MRRPAAFPIVASLIVTLLASACTAGSSPSPSDQPTPSPSAPSASPSPSPSATGTGPTLLEFTTAIPDKQWADPPFKVEATGQTATNVTYSATGGCTVEATSGQVTIVSVGECTIVARADVGTETAEASLSFAIDKAQPVISFGPRKVVFQRPFKPFPLKATVDRPIKLKYRVLPTGEDIDDFCAVTAAGELTLSRTPTEDDFPQLDADCRIEVSAAETSDNYETPEPKVSSITVDQPRFDLKTGNETKSHEGGRVTVTVGDNSGDSLGLDVGYVDNSSGLCEDIETERTSATEYRVTLTVRTDVFFPINCVLVARASPPDWQSGNYEAQFTVTVTGQTP